VLDECIGAGGGADGSGFRKVFRDSAYREVEHCPGCGQLLVQAWQKKELRCIDECVDLD